MFWKYIQPIWTDRLRAAVENAYSVFARYKTNDPFIVCTCDVCMSVEQAKALRTTPLRAIPTELLSEYTTSAHGYDFEFIEPQFKELLPRYLELIAECRPPWHMELEYSLRRLGDADYRNRWPDVERAAVDEFFEAFVEASLAHRKVVKWPVGHRMAFEISEVLTTIIIAGGDVEPSLAIIARAEDPAAALHVASLRTNIAHDKTGEPFLSTAYLNRNHPAARRVGAWAMDERWTARLEGAILTLEDARYLEIIDAGLGNV